VPSLVAQALSQCFTHKGLALNKGGTIEYRTVAAQVAAKASIAPQRSKKARGSSD
jgi:hypothetical protein